MTQPTVHFDDSFPPPQKSEIQELTEAIRDLAAAIRGSNRQQDIDISLEAPLRDWEKDLLYSLDDLPDGAHVDLDPPRALPRAVALKVNIDEDPEIMVHRVVKGEWVDAYGWTIADWHAWSDDDGPETSTPWEFDTEQVEALGLSYSDFTLPAVPLEEVRDRYIAEEG